MRNSVNSMIQCINRPWSFLIIIRSVNCVKMQNKHIKSGKGLKRKIDKKREWCFNVSFSVLFHKSILQLI